MIQMPTRRQFLTEIGVAATTVGLSNRFVNAAESSKNDHSDWPIAIFEKVFEALSYDELADVMVQIGADGVEATIRPDGHIEPEAAAEEVPKMAKAMRERGKQIVIAATHIRRCHWGLC